MARTSRLCNLGNDFTTNTVYFSVKEKRGGIGGRERKNVRKRERGERERERERKRKRERTS